MEDKKLNFDQPFLSVRRQSAIENSAKDGKKKTNHFFAVLPWLPPYRSELKSGPVSNPGAVPFLWEQTPGQPKEEREDEINEDFDRPPNVPKLPPGRFPKDSPKYIDDITHDFKNGTLLDDKVRIFEVGKEKPDEWSESGDSCDAYTDARDTLSRTDSFFLNCSISGLSEFDDLDVKLKQSGSLSRHSKAQDLMMDRFLPAAKAMTSEAPKYGQKKQHVAQEQPQQLKKILMQDQPSLRYGPSFARQYCEYQNCEEESDDEYDQRENLSSVCGLLPRFCLKNSLCLLHPVPTMSMSPANKLQPRSSSSGSYSETENESKSDTYEPRSVDKIQILDFKESRSRLRNEQSHLHSHKALTYLDAPMSFSEEKEVVSVPQKPNKSGIKGIRLHINGCKTFGEFLADHESLDAECPVVEKTLYVDTVHNKVKSPNQPPLSPRTLVTKRLDQMHLIRSSPEDIRKMDSSMDVENLLLVSSVENSNKESGMEMPRNFEDTNDFEDYPSVAENMAVTEKEVVVVLPTESHLSPCELPAPPPLPKSPSDSWLSRTLPSASRNNLSRPQHHGLRQQQKKRMLNGK